VHPGRDGAGLRFHRRSPRPAGGGAGARPAASSRQRTLAHPCRRLPSTPAAFGAVTRRLPADLHAWLERFRGSAPLRLRPLSGSSCPPAAFAVTGWRAPGPCGPGLTRAPRLLLGLADPRAGLAVRRPRQLVPRASAKGLISSLDGEESFARLRPSGLAGSA
jgi:hypothetical protein